MDSTFKMNDKGLTFLFYYNSFQVVLMFFLHTLVSLQLSLIILVGFLGVMPCFWLVYLDWRCLAGFIF